MSSVEAEIAGSLPRKRPPDLDQMLNEHWTPVYRLLLSMTGSGHEAEDLTQETFLRALQRIGTFQDGTNLRAWMLRIAANAFFDERRKRKRRRSEPLIYDPHCSAPPPGHTLETAEQGALVRKALEELSELTRMVFHLRAQEDLSFREVAELAGTTEQAARWHMRQARVKLLAILGEDF